MNSVGLNGVRFKINANTYTNKLPYPRKNTEILKDDYVTDENKSVKWNREQVQLNRETYRKSLKQYYDENNRLTQLFFEDLIYVLTSEFKFSDKASRYLLNIAWEDEHSSGLESVVDKLVDLIKLVQDFNKYNVK